MPSRVAFNASDNVVHCTFEGVVSAVELARAVAAAVQACETHACSRILTDCTDMLVGHSLGDLYDTVTSTATAPRASRMALREAVILPTDTEAIESVQFWQTAASNRGIDVRLFHTRSEGEAWLNTGRDARPQP